MLKWIESYREATPQIKTFVWMWILYGPAIIATTIYCFGRLDYVRSYKAPTPPITKQEMKK